MTKQLAAVYDNSAPSYRTVAKWVAEFKDPTRAFEDPPRSGRTTTVLTDKDIRAVEEVVMRDRQIFVRYVAVNWASQKHHSTKSLVITWDEEGLHEMGTETSHTTSTYQSSRLL